ncbi:hypothetical protein ACJJI5_12345 [Microbulbifer sp. EKSA008]|uniref:hypothetical protein n=1 Tax=Microbulbifer sp. EKSA008 TaxID=3243367 RepID=UPI004041672A
MTEQAPQMPPEQARQFAQIPIGSEPPGSTTYNESGEPIATPAISGEQLTGALLALVFGMLADRRGEHWRLTETETEQLAKTGGALMDHYMPQGGGPGTAFALCMGVALVPRLMTERAKMAEEKKKQEAAQLAQSEGQASGD